MSSFLCFLCHSTVSSETNEDTRDKYRDVVGMHLCPDSHLCYICCHILRKLCLFRAMCLKRSLEYPVLFSEKGTINLLRSDLDLLVICNNDSCKPTPYSLQKSLYTNFNSKTFLYNFNKNNDFYETENSNTETNRYVDFDHRDDLDDISNHSEELVECYTDFENTQHQNFDEFDDGMKESESTPHNYHDLESVNRLTEEIVNEIENTEIIEDAQHNSPIKDLEIEMEEEILKPETKKKGGKTKKVKKRSFTKIVLSFQEQKSVLEEQRKEKKYLEAEFKCHSCALGFLFKDTYQSHMVRHEESNGQYYCSVCGLRFATQNARCMHSILHSELHRCNKCGVAVKRPHRNRHSRACWRRGDQASCHLCGRVFLDANCLQQHLKRFHEAKTSQRIYSCNVCGKTYNEPAAVRTHMLKHLNRRFPCPLCPSTFTSPYTLRAHSLTHATPDPATPDPATPSHYCRQCDTWYKTRKGLNAHLKNALSHAGSRTVNSNHEPAPRKPRSRVTKTDTAYTCHLCAHQSKSLSKLNRHIKEVCERAKLEEQLSSFYEQESAI